MALKATADKNEDDSILDGVAVSTALGAGLGTALPFLLRRFKGRLPQQFLNRTIMSRAGALTGAVVGGFADRWFPQALQQAQKGYRDELSNLQQAKKAGLVDGFLSRFPKDFPFGLRKKRADEILRGVGTGALVGAGISAASIMPVLFGRLGKRLPRKLLNKMVLGRALAGAAAGGAAGGITAKEQPHVFHYNYHGTKGGGK